MSHPNFTFHHDAVNGIVRADLVGFWTLDVVQAYDVGLTDALRVLERTGRPRDRQKVLVDRRNLGILPQDVVVACHEVVTRVMRVARVAIVVPNVLSKFQADRIVPSANMFFDPEEAWRWLMQPVNDVERRDVA